MVENTEAAVLYETNSDLVIENLNLAAPGPKRILFKWGLLVFVILMSM